MSSISFQTASELFDNTVTLKAQNSQYLMNTIKERHGTTGDAVNVPVSAQIEMNQVSFAPTDPVITSVQNTNVTINPYNYLLKTVIGGGYRTLFAYDSITDQAVDHGKAVARAEDFIKLQSIFLYSDFNNLTTIPVQFGANTGMNQQKLAEALGLMADQGWDVGNHQCSLWMPVLAKTSFFNDVTVVNKFYTDQEPLPLDSNRINSYLDVDIRMLGSAGKNALPSMITSGPTERTWLCPLVHRDAVIQIYNRDPGTRMTFVENMDRYEMLSYMTSGAAVIQASGIVLIAVQDPFAAVTSNSAITTPSGMGWTANTNVIPPINSYPGYPNS